METTTYILAESKQYTATTPIRNSIKQVPMDVRQRIHSQRLKNLNTRLVMKGRHNKPFKPESDHSLPKIEVESDRRPPTLLSPKTRGDTGDLSEYLSVNNDTATRHSFKVISPRNTVCSRHTPNNNPCSGDQQAEDGDLMRLLSANRRRERRVQESIAHKEHIAERNRVFAEHDSTSRKAALTSIRARSANQRAGEVIDACQNVLNTYSNAEEKYQKAIMDKIAHLVEQERLEREALEQGKEIILPHYMTWRPQRYMALTPARGSISLATQRRNMYRKIAFGDENTQPGGNSDEKSTGSTALGSSISQPRNGSSLQITRESEEKVPQRAVSRTRKPFSEVPEFYNAMCNTTGFNMGKAVRARWRF